MTIRVIAGLLVAFPGGILWRWLPLPCRVAAGSTHHNEPASIEVITMVAPTSVTPQLHTLATDLQRVGRSGQFIDQQGELVGKAVAGSFKGKVVKMLVKMGVAKEGSLMGRVAVAMIGKPAFDLMRAPVKELQKTSVANVLKLLGELETKGLDRDLGSKVMDKISFRFNENTPIREISARSLDHLHRTIKDSVIPGRLKERQAGLDSITEGTATRTMRQSPRLSLQLAREGIANGKFDAQYLSARLDDKNLSAAQKQDIVSGAQQLFDEMSSITTHYSAQLESKIDQLEQQLAGAGKQPDTQHLQTELNDLKQALNRAGDTISQQYSAALSQKNTGRLVIQDAPEVVGGGWANDLVEGDWSKEFSQEINAAAENGDNNQLLNLARQLADVKHHPDSSPEDRQLAHQLSQHEAFAKDYECVRDLMKEAFSIRTKDNGQLDVTWKLGNEGIETYKDNLEQYETTLKNKYDEVKLYAEKPEQHPDYADYVELFLSEDEVKADTVHDATKEQAHEFITADAEKAMLDAFRLFKAVEAVRGLVNT